MRVCMQGETSIAANSTDNNVLTDQRYERSPYNAMGTLYVNGSAAGLTAELNVGGVSVTPPVQCNTVNATPTVPDDLLISDWEAPMNAKIQLTIVNTTGGALTAFWRVELQEVYARGR